jgi:O-antigen ligase
MTDRPDSGQTDRFAFNPPSARQAQPSAWAEQAPAASAHQAGRVWVPAEPKDWAFTWTLVFTAVLFLRPQDIFPALGVLHLAELSAMAGLVSLFAGRLARRQPITRITPEFAGVLAFGAVLLVTAPFSIWFGGAIGTFQDLYSKVILVYLLAVNVLISPKRLERLTWLLVLALGYLAFRAIIDYARGINMTAHGTRVRGSVGGMMKNPNDLALNMVVFLPFAAYIAMEAASSIKRLTAAACAACMIGAIVASGSRGGFLGFGVMIVVLGAFAARRRPGFVLVGVLVALFALPVVPANYWRRIASITDESKDDVQSSQARRTLMAESVDAFVAHPLTGVGAGMFKNWNPPNRAEVWHEAHNVWLQVAAELGLFGLAAFLFLVVRGFASVVQTRRLLGRIRPAPARTRAMNARRPDADVPGVMPSRDADLLDWHSAAMAASLAGWLVCAFFASVAYNWTFYYLLALAAAPREILRDRLPVVAPRRRAVTAAGAGVAAFATAGKVRA